MTSQLRNNLNVFFKLRFYSQPYLYLFKLLVISAWEMRTKKAPPITGEAFLKTFLLI